MPRKNKNDYSCIVVGYHNGIKYYKKFEYVHNMLNFTKWLSNSKFYNYSYINIYLRRSGQYLQRHYNGNFINPKP